MSRVTSKLQVTIPKAIADEYGIEPGDDVQFVPAGPAIRMIPGAAAEPIVVQRRLELFDATTRRQRAREASNSRQQSKDRGWTRDELHTRGSTR